jgi:hypothetical protein
MYDVNDILARLQNGENADTIAQEFADALNGAIQKRNEEKAAADRKAEKVETLIWILDDIIDFVKEFYPELIVDEDIEVTSEDVERIIKVLDVYVPKFKELNAALANLETLSSKPSHAFKKELPVSFTIDTDPINTFLKQHGLL